jgi:hypothetical protein
LAVTLAALLQMLTFVSVSGADEKRYTLLVCVSTCSYSCGVLCYSGGSSKCHALPISGQVRMTKAAMRAASELKRSGPAGKRVQAALGFALAFFLLLPPCSSIEHSRPRFPVNWRPGSLRCHAWIHGCKHGWMPLGADAMESKQTTLPALSLSRALSRSRTL